MNNKRCCVCGQKVGDLFIAGRRLLASAVLTREAKRL